MIYIKNISKKYNNRKVLDNISLNIREGEATFIVGSSGVGKSTLLNILGGLEKADTGEVIYNCENIANDLCNYRANAVGFIFQDFNLISGLSIKENVELAMLYAKCKIENDKVDSTIKEFGILDSSQVSETLSGGEKQRSAVARSVCKQSKIIIADEPTGNLDSENAIKVMEYISNIKKDKYVIIVSHDLELAQKYADRIITLKDGKIVDDTNPVNEVNNEINNERVVHKKSKCNIKSIWMLGKNSVKKRFSRIMSIALVLALAISALSIVIQFDNTGESISKNVNTNYLENDLINVFYEQTPNTGYKEMPFTSEIIEDINKKYEPAETVQVYLDLDGQGFFSKGSIIADAVIKQININDFFKERVMSNDIKGRFPKKNNEIILAKDVAEKLFGDKECLNEKLYLNDGNGQQIECTIVGVNCTTNPFDSVYSFISAEQVKKLLALNVDTLMYERMEVDKYYSEVMEVKTSGIYGQMSEMLGNEKLLYGNLPKDNHEILISSLLLEYAVGGLLDGMEVNEETLDELFSGKYAINFNGLFEVTICGVYESDNIEFRFTEELIDEMKCLEPIGIDLYAKEPAIVAEIKKDISENQDYVAILQLETLKNNVDMQTKFFRMALLIISVIMAVIGILLLESFSKISVLERKNEIGILKSLGATDMEVMWTLWFDSMFISVLEIALSLGITAISLKIIPVFLKDIEMFSMEFPIILLLGLGISSMIIVMTFSLLMIKKVIKDTPATLLKQ